MKQFSLEQWVDYIHGLASDELAAAMASELQRGQPDAVRLHQLASGVAASAQWLSSGLPDVPRDVVQRAASIFQPVAAESVFRLPLLPVKLLFDSLLAPQPVGLRTQGSLHRETIHAAGEFQLSLRMEQEPGTEVMALIGQILPNENVSQGVAHRPVFVFQKDKLVARTLSSDSGEFQLEFSGRQPLRLVLAMAEPERRIELDLSGPSQKPVKKRKPLDRSQGSGETQQ